MPCTVYHSGLTDYSEASRLQKDICRRVIEGEAGDTLILLEHQPTITIGKSGKLENVLVSEARLARAKKDLGFSVLPLEEAVLININDARLDAGLEPIKL
jgi:lipoyl(octanoyl) transferase